VKAGGVEGPVTAQARVVKGVLQDGSTFTSVAPGLTLDTRLLSASGQGAVTVGVQDGERRLDVSLTQPRVTSPEHEPWLRAQQFRLVSKGPADLAAEDVFDGTLTLTKGRADDLRFVNRFIPEPLGLAVVSGRGLFDATVAVNSSTSKGSGSVVVLMEDLELRNRVSRVLGSAELRGMFQSFDLKTGAMRLDGSSFTISRARIFADNREYQGFSATLAAPSCVVNPQGAVKWKTTLDLKLQTLQPVLGMVAAQVPIPFPVRLMAEHQDLTASVAMLVRKDDVELNDVRVHSERLDVWGDLNLRDGKQGVFGAVLVKSPPVVAAIELKGAQVTPILIDAEPWFRKWKVERDREVFSAKELGRPGKR
jgi:hypothetical protein